MWVRTLEHFSALSKRLNVKPVQSQQTINGSEHAEIIINHDIQSPYRHMGGTGGMSDE